MLKRFEATIVSQANNLEDAWAPGLFLKRHASVSNRSLRSSQANGPLLTSQEPQRSIGSVANPVSFEVETVKVEVSKRALVDATPL